MNPAPMRKVLVLVNHKSGLWWSFDHMRRSIERAFEDEQTDLSYQFTRSAEDGSAKARRALAKGVDTVLVVGGDGTINTIGRELIGSSTVLGAIPAGSGNGFARHFEIPLNAEKAVQALAAGRTLEIDVGAVDNRPFLVTCSMAWEAALTDSFQKSPVRGILPYILAGVQELFDYEPQDISVVLDHEREFTFSEPMVFTVANLSQYGGGARIAPQALANDGHLELIVALKQDLPALVASLTRLFDGSINTVPQLFTHRFQHMTVRRANASPIQIDGEIVEAGTEIEVSVMPSTLKILVP